MPFRFEGLEIWHKARDFSARIYEVTAKFPQHELYGLANHRLGLAVGETSEVASAAFLALDRKYISAEQQANIHEWADELARKINAFRRTLR